MSRRGYLLPKIENAFLTSFVWLWIYLSCHTEFESFESFNLNIKLYGMYQIFFMLFKYGVFFDPFNLDSYDWDFMYASKMKTKFSQVASNVNVPILFRRSNLVDLIIGLRKGLFYSIFSMSSSPFH